MRNLARAAALLGLSVLPAAALAATGAHRVLVPNCARAVYKPKRLILSCGDGSNQLTQLTWTHWTARAATGSGVDEVNNCMPDCVSGHFQRYPATVTLSRPQSCKHLKQPVFGRIVLHYTGAHPGSASTIAAGLACPF